MDPPLSDFSDEGGFDVCSHADQHDDVDATDQPNLDYRFTISTFKSGIPTSARESIDAKIAAWSKGSAFYENEQRKSAVHEAKIQKLLTRVEQLTASELALKEIEVDGWIRVLEKECSSEASIVLMDLDAFYASVEERDRPELKTLPMAVGDLSMLSTSNYVARKYGVRSGMPGYLAKKLCPELNIIPLNFEKYKIISKQVFAIQKKYDPDVRAWGLDEAYLDLTQYLKEHPERDVEEVVNEIRRTVYTTVQITASAGIACNRLLAKICADIQKPNGQHRLPSDRDTVCAFMAALPIRKVFGVGRVMEHTLKALGVQTCADFLEKRAMLALVLSEKMFRYLLPACLGLEARREDENDTDGFPKSISSERTFPTTSDVPTLLSILESLADDVAEDLARRGWTAHHVTLKCKSSEFRVQQMGHTTRRGVRSAPELFQEASAFLAPLLSKLQAPLRLLGIRTSAFQHERQSLRHYVENAVVCPVCHKAVREDLNVHLDLCLFLENETRQTSATTVSETQDVTPPSITLPVTKDVPPPSISAQSSKKKRPATTSKRKGHRPTMPSLHQFLTMAPKNAKRQKVDVKSPTDDLKTKKPEGP